MAAAPVSTAIAPAAFIGRAGELVVLQAQFEAVRAGQPRVVLVEGPPGMGKSALVRRFLAEVDGCRRLQACGDEPEASLAYGMLAQLLQGPRTDPGAPVDVDAKPGDDPLAVGAQVLGLLGRLQADGPLILVIDDAQWADAPSLRALTFALRRLRADAVLTVLIARDDCTNLPNGLSRLVRDNGGARLALGGLGASELGQLCVALGVDRPSPAGLDRLWAHTGGNPLHAGALAEELGAGGLDRPLAALPATRSFTRLVRARLGGCSDATVRLVQAAAVMDRHFPLGMAALLADVDDTGRAVEEAVAAHLLEFDSTSRLTGFPHPLVRAAIYDDMGPLRRSELHARAAAMVEGPVALRHRVAAAFVEDPALAAEVEAHARQELARGAAASAGDFFSAAASLHPERTQREWLTLDAVEAFVHAGEMARASAIAEGAASFADTARRCYVLGHLALMRGCQQEAEARLVEAWDRRSGGDGELVPRIAADLAQVCAMQLRSDEAAEWARRAIELSEDPEVTASAMSVIVPCLGRVGRPAHALAVATESLGATRRNPVDVDALLGRGMVRLWVDEVVAATQDLAEVLDACRELPASRPALVALGMLADAEYRLGNWDQSVAHGARLVSLMEDSDQVWFGAFAHAAATWALAPRGDLALAEEHARAATAAGQVLGDATSVGCAATAVAHVAFFRGDYPTAIQAVQPMLDLGVRAAADEPSVHPWRELHVESLLRVGRLDEAEAALAALEELAVSRGRRSAMAHACRLRAQVDAARGHHDTAGIGFEAAIRQAGDLSSPFDRARAEYSYGLYLRRLGERRAAAGHLRSAHAGFVAVGAWPLVQRCDAELAACGLRPPPRSKPRGSALTPQELAVARAVATGRTNREVAAELVLSIKTVEYHLGHVYAKLGITSRHRLAAALDA